MNKTPYPTNLEIVLFLADVLDVREKGKGLYKASKKPLRHFYYQLMGLVVNYITDPVKDRMGVGVEGIVDSSSFCFDEFWRNIFFGFWDYRSLPHEFNVGDIDRDELMPVLIEEVFVPWAVMFMLGHDSSSMRRVLKYVVGEGFREDVNPVRAVDGFLSKVYGGRKFCSGEPFPPSFPKSLLACVYPDSTGVGKVGRDAFNRMRTPSNTTVINVGKDIASINNREPGEEVFCDLEICHIKACIFFGAIFNRCLDRAERYVSRSRLMEVLRDVHDRASSNNSHVDMEFYKKRFKERISSMLNSCGGSSASEPRYVLHMREARRLLSEGLPAAAVDECVKAARTAAYSGGRLEYAVVNEAFCMLSFMYRFGSELWDGGCGDGRKMRGELRYMKEILLGFGYLYGFWLESERECEEGCCYEFKGRAVVVGKGGFAVEEGLSSEEVSDVPPTIVGGGLSDYEVTESAMNFVEHRLGGYENSHVIGLIGGVDRWRYKRVISGYRTWHGESVYNEIVSVDGKWL